MNKSCVFVRHGFVGIRPLGSGRKKNKPLDIDAIGHRKIDGVFW